MNDVRYWLWFIMAFYPANERIWQLIIPYQDIKQAYEAVCDGNHPSMSRKEQENAVSTRIEQCDSIIQYCNQNGYRIITFDDENYPPLLRNIYNPPAVLFCMGNIENFNRHPAIACVGTRKPSVYSVDVTEKICGELSRRGFAVVSGFALGLDSVAHRAALNSNGCTVAVLASGIDVNYPKENEKFKNIIAKKGAVITEYLPGTHADKKCFQNRNRLISGMCFGTLVTEADETSGALITANHAAEQSRSVFCIPPGDIFDKRYSGVVKFLRDGAIPVFSHLDILYDYYTSEDFLKNDSEFKWPEFYNEEDVPIRDSRTVKRPKTTRKVKTASPDSDNKEQNDETGKQWEQLYESMNEEQCSIIDCLKSGEKHPDEISNITRLDSFRIMAVITELEIMGAVTLLPDHKYRLC